MSLLFSNVFVMLRHFATSVLCVSVFQRYSSVLSVITGLKCHRRNHLTVKLKGMLGVLNACCVTLKVAATSTHTHKVVSILNNKITFKIVIQ